MRTNAIKSFHLSHCIIRLSQLLFNEFCNSKLMVGQWATNSWWPSFSRSWTKKRNTSAIIASRIGHRVKKESILPGRDPILVAVERENEGPSEWKYQTITIRLAEYRYTTATKKKKLQISFSLYPLFLALERKKRRNTNYVTSIDNNNKSLYQLQLIFSFI